MFAEVLTPAQLKERWVNFIRLLTIQKLFSKPSKRNGICSAWSQRSCTAKAATWTFSFAPQGCAVLGCQLGGAAGPAFLPACQAIHLRSQICWRTPLLESPLRCDNMPLLLCYINVESKNPRMSSFAAYLLHFLPRKYFSPTVFLDFLLLWNGNLFLNHHGFRICFVNRCLFPSHFL